MNQIKSYQYSVETQRKRNNSFKTEKTYFEQAQRRKSVYLDQMDSESLQIRNVKSFLPSLKQSSSNSDNYDITKILQHYKIYNSQLTKLNNWNQFFAEVWDYVQKNGDLFDQFQELFKKIVMVQHHQIIKQIQDICYYDKILISLGYEMCQDQLFVNFFEKFVTNYLSSLQELFTKGKFNKKQLQDVVQCISLTNPAIFCPLEDLYEKFQQGNNTIWMIFRKCRVTSSYKLNYKIIRRHFALWLHETRNLEVIRQLPKQLLTASQPFINSKLNNPILILDLDETLVHFEQNKNKLLIRNGALNLLQQMHKHFYIIIWTASLPRYAKWALKKIDAQIDQHIDLLLTREYCVPHERGHYQKFLSMLGQDLSQLLIIENDVRSIIDQEKDYLYLVESFIGQDDNVLQDTANRLIDSYAYYQEGFSFQRAVKMTYIK